VIHLNVRHNYLRNIIDEFLDTILLACVALKRWFLTPLFSNSNGSFFGLFLLLSAISKFIVQSFGQVDFKLLLDFKLSNVSGRFRAFLLFFLLLLQ